MDLDVVTMEAVLVVPKSADMATRTLVEALNVDDSDTSGMNG